MPTDVSSTEYAAGRVFPMEDESSIRADFLEAFVYEGPRQRIKYRTNEFAALCPFSGLPDMGTIWIKYIPQTKLVELKALKYYLMSFRNVGIFQEAVTSRIYQDLHALLNPEALIVRTRYATRGGIDTTCTITSDDQP